MQTYDVASMILWSDKTIVHATLNFSNLIMKPKAYNYTVITYTISTLPTLYCGVDNAHNLRLVHFWQEGNSGVIGSVLGLVTFWYTVQYGRSWTYRGHAVIRLLIVCVNCDRLRPNPQKSRRGVFRLLQTTRMIIDDYSKTYVQFHIIWVYIHLLLPWL